MSRDIIDNHGQRLADRICDFLQDGASSARFAVGYLFLDGLVPLRDEIERLDEVEILIGNVVSRLTDEQVREEAATRLRGGENFVLDQADMAVTLRELHDLSAVETALNLRRTLADLPQTPDTHALLLILARRIADGGLKVRLYSEGRIHAKLALIGYPEDNAQRSGIAVVGSSNLTLGAAAHATEMNVVVRDRDSVTALESWYRRLWDVSQDFHRELFDELGLSWAMQTETFAKFKR